MTKTISCWLEYARSELQHFCESPNSDAIILLKNFLGVERTWIVSNPELPLTEIQLAQLDSQLKLALKGYPIPYIVGNWDFFGLRFLVTPKVLIPRPETELLVEQALAWLSTHPDATTMLEVGTGSGCISIATAKLCRRLKVFATDISIQALQIACLNLLSHGVFHRIQLVRADMASCFETKFDLICSNPPYIPTKKLQALPVSNWEPMVALDGGEAGVEKIEVLLTQSAKLLKSPGLLLCEIEETTHEKVKQLAYTAFPNAQVRIMPDLSGTPRLLIVNT